MRKILGDRSEKVKREQSAEIEQLVEQEIQRMHMREQFQAQETEEKETKSISEMNEEELADLKGRIRQYIMNERVQILFSDIQSVINLVGEDNRNIVFNALYAD